MQVSVRQVHVSSEPDSSYFLRVDWRGRGLASGFQLLLTDGQDAWRGEVSEAAVSDEAAELEMEVQQYEEDLRRALTDADAGGSVTYGFSLTPPPSDRGAALTLEYEKVRDDFSFRLGSVELTAVPAPAEAVRQLLSHSLQRGNSLQNHNQNLEQENQRLRREQQRITAELKRYSGGKESLEAELYSRFVLVLNEKKKKIRSLQEVVTQLQDVSSAGQKQRSERQEEEDYGGSTDEEPEEEQSAAASSSSSTRERSAASPLDDSLKDITDVAPTRKRRFRHLGAPEPAVKRPAPQSAQRARTDPPAGSSKQQSPPRPPTAEDLFEDF